MSKIVEYDELPDSDHGRAFSEVVFTENGEIWITNGEYSSQVNYCPMTGEKAKIQITEEIIEENNSDYFEMAKYKLSKEEYFKIKNR